MSKPVAQPLFRVHEFGPASDQVVFLFCPFGIPAWQMALPLGPVWHYRRKGYQIICYDYPLSIANHSPQHTIMSLKAISADARHRIGSLPKRTRVACWGTSLGTALAVYTAAHNRRVSHVILNLSYGDIAEHIIHLPFMWLVLPHIKHNYITAAGGAAGLHRLFDPYSPLHLASRLGGKSVLLYLSRNDRIQHWEHTEQLPAKLRKAGARLTYYEHRWLGHYLGCLVNHIRANRYKDFF
jgi:acetyl esterase/lipase